MGQQCIYPSVLSVYLAEAEGEGEGFKEKVQSGRYSLPSFLLLPANQPSSPLQPHFHRFREESNLRREPFSKTGNGSSSAQATQAQ
jgi:hypothetical protein